MAWFRGALLLVATGGCGSGGGFPDARVIDSPPPGGTFSLDWSVTDALNNNISCDRVGGQSVTVLAHNRAFDGGTTQPFTCSTGMGTSQALTPGTYDFDFELDSATGQLATAPAQHTIEITSGQNVRLAPLTFAVDATGKLSLTVATGRPTNCGVAPTNGGITATTLTLVHSSDLTCEPLTVNISASAISGAGASQYTINCGAPTNGPCIETDQTITATAPSDAYQIHIRGKQGVTNCWSNDDSIQVPPLGQTLTRQLNLMLASGGGCL